MAIGNGSRMRSGKKPLWENLTDEEVLSIVVNLVVRGTKLSGVVAHMRDYYGERNFKQSHPYLYLRRAAERGMLAFSLANGRDHVIEQKIRESCPGLKTVEVVNSVVPTDIADRAARRIIEWAQQRGDAGQAALRVGLMGGGTIMAVCRALAPALAGLAEDEKQRLPALTFQALAVGDNVREPLEDPASFFTYFADPWLNPLRRDYIAVHAPVFRAPGQHDGEDREFEQLRAEARSCDIVLVSAGVLDDRHSFLGRLQSTAPDIWQRLRDANCKGDLGRLPVSLDGPMSLSLFEKAPCTLIGLDDLSAMVQENRRVMVIAAPCGDCRAHKAEIIQTLLEVRDKGFTLFSDLVCDSHTGRRMSLLTRGRLRSGGTIGR